MKWIIISDDLQVRLEDGKPKFASDEGISLEQAAEAVSFWLKNRDNAEAEAWLERAADELDLQKRMARILEGDRALLELDRLIGDETSIELGSPRARAISERDEERVWQREFMQGEEASRLGDCEKAVAHLSPAAKAFHPDACFLLGQLYEKGMGVPQNYVRAYELFADAAEFGTKYPAEEAKARITKFMSVEELKEARRIWGKY